MNSTKFFKNNVENEIPEDLLNSIIRVAYNDEGYFEKLKVMKLAEKDDRVKELLNEYQITALSVHNLTPIECPDNLVEKACRKVKIEQHNKPSIFFDIYNLVFTRPAISAAAALLLVTAITISVFINNRGELYEYNTEEIDLANRQAKYALAIVGKVFSSTSKSLTEDIIGKKVSKPINEGIKTVNKLFIEEENKNEN